MRRDASRSMSACAAAVLILRDARAPAGILRTRLRLRAPQDEDGDRVRNHFSRCQTAHLVPAARFLRPGFEPFASRTPMKGWRSAERRTGARTPGACT